MIILTQILIVLIIVFIIDLSGAPEHLFKPIIKKILKLKQTTNISIGPLECSLCLSFWVLIIYTLIASPSLINITTACLLSYLTTTIKSILELFKSILDSLLCIIQKYIDKIL